MGYLTYNKKQLANLPLSLNAEHLQVNQLGAFSASTLIFCNTRKYHGLLSVPLEEIDGGYHVLLSSLDETIIEKDKEFHLGVHKYPGVMTSGHEHITQYTNNPIPTVHYKVGGLKLKKEVLLLEKENKVMVRYTPVEMQKPITIRLLPFLAFRNVHALSKANFDANTDLSAAKNGVATRLYGPYPHLHMQLSRKNEFIPSPDWFYNIEYEKELERGYDAHEDLLVPGYFEFTPKKGQSIVFVAGLEESTPNQLNRRFESQFKKQPVRQGMEDSLIASAQQFIAKRNGGTYVIAAFPWTNVAVREAFIALPGLTLGTGQEKLAEAILDTYTQQLEGAFFHTVHNSFEEPTPSVDSSLWYIWAIQQWVYTTDNYKKAASSYWEAIKQILGHYKTGTDYNIQMDEEGMLSAGDGNMPLTWMNAMANGEPVTPRNGYAVEVNALWYNAIKFALELAEKAGDKEFAKEWKDVAKHIEGAFPAYFWDNDKGYLADTICNGRKDFSVRPNQVIAVSLPYTAVDKNVAHAVLDVAEELLLTPRGLRTLSYQNGRYTGICVGNVYDRAIASHQGSVWPWLLGFFADAYLKTHGQKAKTYIRRIYQDFEEEMLRDGLGTISELYDGNDPHRGRGAISYASNVAELLRIGKLLAKKQ